MTTDAEAKVAFEAIELELRKPQGESFTLSTTSACEQYRKVKKYLEMALPWIEKLPYGATLTMAIKLLMSLADMACPTVPKPA